MVGKPVRDTAVVMAQMMIPQDANPAGNVHGGVILKLIDEAAGVVAMRHSRANAVTASIDRMDFHTPVFVGNLLSVKASLNYAGKTSMEIGVRVEAENLLSGEIHHAASAYLTYVALDPDGKPQAVPSIILETDEERRRHREAGSRRLIRLAERRRETVCLQDPAHPS